MKIIFDLRRTGLGNNGGSSTLIKSGNILRQLGNEVIFVDSGPNKHTWNILECEHKIISDLPSADFIIATGYKSVAPTISAPERCGIKMHWIRAWETWQYNDNDILNLVLKQPTIKLVNSICLQNKLSSYKIESHIVRPGYDFSNLFPLNIRSSSKDIILGGLYREGVHGKRKRVEWLLEAGKYFKEKYSDIKFYLFGSEKDPKNSYVDEYLMGPSSKEKNDFYNRVHIWLAPTMSEGLHLTPAEAMLAECPVVGTNAELSGMQDYLFDGKTGMVSKDNFESFIYEIETLYLDRDLRVELGKNARKQILELGDRVTNMKKFINLMERLK